MKTKLIQLMEEFRSSNRRLTNDEMELVVESIQGQKDDKVFNDLSDVLFRGWWQHL